MTRTHDTAVSRVPDPSVTPAVPSTGAPTVDPYQAVDASIVPVPIESLNRLVIAVDELGSEMTHVREAIRELTTTLSESQAGFARLVAHQVSGTTPDPLAAVTGPYVAGSPSPPPFTEPTPGVDHAVPPSFEAGNGAVAGNGTSAHEAFTLDAHPDDAAHHPVPAAPEPSVRYTTPDGQPTSDLGDLPIVQTGDIPVVVGPIGTLDELDAAVDDISRINGVESVSVTSFEGSQVVLTAELSRTLPLASLLRSALGRDVVSCRLVDGRIVVDFGEAGHPS